MLKIQTRLLYNNLSPSPMGAIGLSSIVKNSFPGYPGMRILGSYCLVYVLEGRANYTDVGGRNISLVPGDLFFCYPEIAHRIGPEPGQQHSEFYITFQGPIFDLWRREKLLNPDQIVHHIEPIEYWLGRFETMLRNFPAERTEPLVAACALQQLLAEALAFEQQPATSQTELAWLGQVQDILSGVERADELDLNAIASDLFMSYASFRQKFARLAGIPPGRFHMIHLMQRACKLMYEQSLTNREIAEQCGFCNEFYFSQRFKQIIGITTRDFRRRFHADMRLLPPSEQNHNEAVLSKSI